MLCIVYSRLYCGRQFEFYKNKYLKNTKEIKWHNKFYMKNEMYLKYSVLNSNFSNKTFIL